MSSSSISSRSEHEYRHVYAILPSCGDGQQGNPDHDAAFVDRLIELVADLRRADLLRADDEGWKLLSVQVRTDARRRQWVDAYLNRPRSTDRELRKAA